MGCKKLEMGCITRDKNSVLNVETIVKELLSTGNRPAIFKRESNRVNLKISKVKLRDATGAITESYITNDNKLKQLKPTKKSNTKKSNNVINQEQSDNNHSKQSLNQKNNSVIKKPITSNTGKRKKSIKQ